MACIAIYAALALTGDTSATVGAGIAAFAAVSLVIFDVDTNAIANLLLGIAVGKGVFAFSFVAGFGFAARRAAGSAVLGIGLDVDANAVTRGGSVGAGTNSSDALLLRGAGVAAGAAVLGVGLEVETAAKTSLRRCWRAGRNALS